MRPVHRLDGNIRVNSSVRAALPLPTAWCQPRMMGFKVITGADGSADSYGLADVYVVHESGALIVDREDGSTVIYSPYGGWVRVEVESREARA
jgi:hypothetical protein